MKKNLNQNRDSKQGVPSDLIKIHHPIESLGVVRATRGEIRAEQLQKRLTPKVPFPHKHDFYQIVLIENGRGWHQIDFDRFDVTKSQCFIIKPGQVHSWTLTPQTKGSVIEFTLESLFEGKSWGTDYLSKLRLLPNMILLKEQSQSNEVVELSNRMEQEFAEKTYGFEITLQSYLKIFLIHLIRLSSHRDIRTNDSISTLDQFRQIIDENFHQHHGVDFYSKSLGLSSKALTMRTSRATGKSARELIQERILIEAKRLLLYTSASVKEIAYQLGFEDPNYFVRFFREQVGTTPLKFRQNSQD